MSKYKELDKYLFYRKLDKIFLFVISIFFLVGVFYWLWTNDKRINTEYKIGTMIGFDKGFRASSHGLEGVPVFLVELDDGRKVKIDIRSGASMLKNRKVEVMEISNEQTGISNFELVRYMDENN